MELTTQVDRMFMALPTMLRARRVNKRTGRFDHSNLYLCVTSTRNSVVMGYHSGRKEKVMKGDGTPTIIVTGSSLSECVKQIYDTVQRLGLREDELLIIDI